ncbi:hypothetical protein [Paraburkholderia caribensis]|nr:hypothetical protein [Paraburkholderia caribensis]
MALKIIGESVVSRDYDTTSWIVFLCITDGDAPIYGIDPGNQAQSNIQLNVISLEPVLPTNQNKIFGIENMYTVTKSESNKGYYSVRLIANILIGVESSFDITFAAVVSRRTEIEMPYTTTQHIDVGGVGVDLTFGGKIPMFEVARTLVRVRLQ